MDSRKDDWNTWIMIGVGALGGITGFIFVYLLANILGRFWGVLTSILILIALSYLVYKVVIE